MIFVLSAAHLVSRHPFARRKEQHTHNLARLVRYKGRRRCGQIKSAPLQISQKRHDQAPAKKYEKRCAKCGHTISPIHFTQPSTQLLGKNWSFSSEARYTVTRITLFRFADTTSASVPQSKDFPDARESASSPAVSKINVPAASAPRTAKLYHFPSPRVNCRARPNWHEVSAPKIYFHASRRRMTLPCVPTGISSGSWHFAGRSRGMFL